MLYFISESVIRIKRSSRSTHIAYFYCTHSKRWHELYRIFNMTLFLYHISQLWCVFFVSSHCLFWLSLCVPVFCSFFAVSLRSYLHVCFTVYLFSHFNSVIAVFFIFIFYTLTLQQCLKCILLANKMNFCKKEMHIKPSALNTTTTIKKIPLSCF